MKATELASLGDHELHEKFLRMAMALGVRDDDTIEAIEPAINVFNNERHRFMARLKDRLESICGDPGANFLWLMMMAAETIVSQSDLEQYAPNEVCEELSVAWLSRMSKLSDREIGN